jgi:putative endonuclease
MPYFVYIIKTIDRLKNKTYVGYTNDLSKRLKSHNENKGAKATRGYKWVIIYKKRFINKSNAMSYEYKLKNDRKKRASIIKLSNDKKI